MFRKFLIASCLFSCLTSLSFGSIESSFKPERWYVVKDIVDSTLKSLYYIKHTIVTPSSPPVIPDGYTSPIFYKIQLHAHEDAEQDIIHSAMQGVTLCVCEKNEETHILFYEQNIDSHSEDTKARFFLDGSFYMKPATDAEWDVVASLVPTEQAQKIELASQKSKQ